MGRLLKHGLEGKLIQYLFPCKISIHGCIRNGYLSPLRFELILTRLKGEKVISQRASNSRKRIQIQFRCEIFQHQFRATVASHFRHSLYLLHAALGGNKMTDSEGNT